MAMSREAHVLVVAGSDSSGGAGVARDIETIAAFGLRSCLAVTAVTVQTHTFAGRIETMPPGLVAEQMHAALAANRVTAIKIGMLGTAATIEAAAAVLREHAGIPVVLDPVLATSSGQALLSDSGVAVMKRDLIPLCSLVTPNLIELARLAGTELAQNEADKIQRGRQVLAEGCPALLIKDGHASDTQSTDILLRLDEEPLRFDAPRLAGSMRGTGCMLASAIAAKLALDESLETSVCEAKQYVFDRLGRAA
ncbi:MAG: hydroxymethylpyrimidine/phosphomethylpyrimidine kinase [Mesorhizobium sp.]|nr:hydroxymethylpyrimidine/phosphomethylpyrimidine kinase [Mesorhizobium sp.]RWJ32105.1 MAG: hydroxymethylpyrimidine/phosphomethylpyrimidine kinase [Mesorhizobium sp.]TIQ74097.1 MAG: hydroxymethylpyrimidine/phosphomethylpyrimidine kinase [Mesorhizobium sp.]